MKKFSQFLSEAGETVAAKARKMGLKVMDMVDGTISRASLKQSCR